jgi:hypothetical protein
MTVSTVCKSFLATLTLPLLLSPAQCPAALVNLALSGTPNASSADFGSAAADGNDGNRDSGFNNGSVWHSSDPGAGNGTPVFYEITLPGPRVLDHLRIFNRMDVIQGSITNFQITAWNGAAQVYTGNYLPAASTHGTGAGVNASVAWGTDDLRGVTATRVRIERLNTAAPNFMTFAEFELWGSNTGSVMAPYIAPVLTTGSAAGFGTLVANAADGNIDGNYTAPGNPIYHSLNQGAGQFWEMDLGGNYAISELLVFNRTDSPTTNNVRISLLDSSNLETWSMIQNLTRGGGLAYNYGFDLPVGAVGQRVRIETIGNDFLALGEVQAFGNLVPEPSVALLGFLTVAGAALRRRR